MGLIQIWKNRGQILEGIKNSIFKKEHIEEIAAERLAICKACPNIDVEGSKCEVPGTQPCCDFCGCCLAIMSRSLSSSCGDEENPRWNAILSQEEEDELKSTIGYQEPSDE